MKALRAVSSLILCLCILILSVSFSPFRRVNAEELPSAVDLRQDKHLPPIGNQGALGCCASMAITYTQFTNAYSRYLESIDENSSFDPSSGNKAYLLSPKFTYNLAGAGTAWVYEILKEQGTLPMNLCDFSYDSAGGAINNTNASSWTATAGMWQQAQDYRISDYEQIWIGSDPYDYKITTSVAGNLLIEKIKTALHNGNVVVTGGYPSRWQYTTISGTGSYGKTGEHAIYLSRNLSSGGHQVSIVGYDDEITCTVSGVTLKGAFLVANSWGKGWMDKGYTWMMYDALNLTSPYEALNLSDRTWTMDQMCFLDWRTDLKIGTPDYTASVKLTTADRDGFAVTLTATDLQGNCYEYTPYTFSQEWARPYKGVNFTGGSVSVTGTLCFSYDELAKKLPAGTDLDDYRLGLTVRTDGTKSVTVKEVSLLDKRGASLYSESPQITLPASSSYSVTLSELKSLRFHLSEGVSVKSVSGLPYSSSGEEYSFTLEVASRYTADKLSVSCNGKKLIPVQGVYTLQVSGDLTVTVSGVVPKAKSVPITTYCYEYWSGDDACVAILSVNNSDVLPLLYDTAALQSGTYPYTFRITAEGATYEIVPSSFYHFSSSSLYRLPVADGGWLPKAGKKDIKVEICLEGIPVYVDNSVTGNNPLDFYATHTSLKTHTHSYTSDKVVVTKPATCKTTGEGYRYCSVADCKALTKVTLPVDNTTHRFDEAPFLLTPATAERQGTKGCVCSDCGASHTFGFLPKAFDVNGDDAISISDVTLYLSFLAGQAEESEVACKKDLDGDDGTSISDVTALLNKLAGKP